MADDIEVLIAGAGPVGLALALELQRFGIRFRIVEKKAERSTTSKALGLQPRLSEVFAIQGIEGQFAAHGFSDIRAVNARSGAKKLLTITVRPPANQAGRDACQPRMFIIPQSVTEEILETALQERGHAVERRRELAGIEQEAGGVNAVVRNDNGSQETIAPSFSLAAKARTASSANRPGFPSPAPPCRSVSCSPMSRSIGTCRRMKSRSGFTATVSSPRFRSARKSGG